MRQRVSESSLSGVGVKRAFHHLESSAGGELNRRYTPVPPIVTDPPARCAGRSAMKARHIDGAAGATHNSGRQVCRGAIVSGIVDLGRFS
jgi:hypothetical protein